MDSSRGIIQEVIEREMHIEEISQDAMERLSRPEDQPLPVQEYWTGAVQARNTEDWVYGVSRRAIAPRKSGLNFSYNSLFGGAGTDDQALPKVLQHKYFEETAGVVTERRQRAKARAAGVLYRDARGRAADAALGLVRGPLK